MDNQFCTHIGEFSLNTPKSHNHVYKDECTLCYVTSQSAEGINVCLKCFNGSCTTNNHTQQHFERTRHSIFVNMKKTKKDSEFYKTKTFCFKCGPVVINNEKMIVDGIKMATNPDDLIASKTFYDGLKSFCSHFDTIEQTKANFRSKLICNDCNNPSPSEKTSQWLCLSCGKTSCGRRNYDGTGGNNHGVEHFQKEKHPLAVKLGTITENGDADVFCYVCDETVNNPKILDHLKFFGISEFVKTEKNTKELEQELNRKYDWSKIGEYDDSEMMFGAGFTGIKNERSSCYISCVMQILLSIPEYINFYHNPAQQIEHKCPLFNTAGCFVCQMSKFSFGLYSGDYSKPVKMSDEKELDNLKSEYLGISESSNSKRSEDQLCQEGISLSMLRSAICADNKEFLSDKQQDAFEFLQYFLSVQESFEKLTHLSELFSFQFEIRIECSSCNNEEFHTESATFLSLKTEKKLTKAIQDMMRIETLDGRDCENCGPKQKFTKLTRFVYFPDVLVVHLNRFYFENDQLQKSETEVRCENNIDLNEYKSDRCYNKEEYLNMSSNKKAKFVVDEGSVGILRDMGFEEYDCISALKQHKNNVELAIASICNGTVAYCENDEENRNENITKKVSTCPKFELFGFITHLGKNTAHGHYIAHVKRESTWVCFNDTKVFKSDGIEHAKKSYVLFYRNKAESE